MTDILFLIKEGYDYNAPAKVKGGLYNSTYLTKKVLSKEFKFKKFEMDTCIDGNSIDAKIHKYNPKICILQAIWVTPEKLRELTALHKKVKFIVLIHSKIPFLAMEGMSITWIKEFVNISGVTVAFNNKETSNLFKDLGVYNIYLPNLYHRSKEAKNIKLFDVLCENEPGNEVNIGCFGAIRPLKNQLFQAAAAIKWGNLTGVKIKFHINSGRKEQAGDNVLKNIKALFKNTRHELIEHSWLSHDKFLDLIKSMDLGLQVSFTESFNIVTADFVSQNIPIIGSNDIKWMPDISKTNTFSDVNLVEKIDFTLKRPGIIINENNKALRAYSEKAIINWRRLIKII